MIRSALKGPVGWGNWTPDWFQGLPVLDFLFLLVLLFNDLFKPHMFFVMICRERERSDNGFYKLLVAVLEASRAVWVRLSRWSGLMFSGML